MSDSLKLEIVTPEAKIFSDDVDMVTLTGGRGRDGHSAAAHAADDAACGGRNHRAARAEETIFLAVGDGFVQVTGDRVAMLTDMAINADNIDEAKAEEALRRAEARLAEKISDEEAARVQAALATPPPNSRSNASEGSSFCFDGTRQRPKIAAGRECREASGVRAVYRRFVSQEIVGDGEHECWPFSSVQKRC